MWEALCSSFHTGFYALRNIFWGLAVNSVNCPRDLFVDLKVTFKPQNHRVCSILQYQSESQCITLFSDAAATRADMSCVFLSRRRLYHVGYTEVVNCNPEHIQTLSAWGCGFWCAEYSPMCLTWVWMYISRITQTGKRPKGWWEGHTPRTGHPQGKG